MSRLINRRQIIGLAAAGAASLALPLYARAQGKARIVVVGGGAGGATASKYAAMGGRDQVEVTLIEDSETFTTCFFSNHYIAGLRDFASITHSYDRLVSAYGIRKITGRATAIDRSAKQVRLADGQAVPYDFLVLSPGIDIKFDSVAGYSEKAAEIAPHAWHGGQQTQLLRSKLDTVEDGQSIVIVAPPNPYRCPPGPYERASVFAHVLKAKGYTRSRIFVLDHKDKFSKQALFDAGWASHYPGMIEWHGPATIGAIKGVDAQAGKVETDFGAFEGALLNIIPAQAAGAIASETGLANETGYCPIEAASMRSSLDRSIFVIGDASIAGEMPKSAFSANSQAKVAVAAILADIRKEAAPSAAYMNTCWSMLEVEDSVKIGARYAAQDGKIAATENFISAVGETAAQRKATFAESLAWYDAATKDMFG